MNICPNNQKRISIQSQSTSDNVGAIHELPGFATAISTEAINELPGFNASIFAGTIHELSLHG